MRGPHRMCGQRRAVSHVSSSGACGHIGRLYVCTSSRKTCPISAPPTPALSPTAAIARPVSASPIGIGA